jgi:threonine dehydrogenase-like Zn-dependent dehydrogenase
MESVIPPFWSGPGLHLHRAYDEAVSVLDGTVAFTLDGVDHVCPAGSFVFMPRGVSHGFSNPSADPARILPVVTPDAIRLVEELFQLERVGQTAVEAGLEHAAVDPAAVAALYARYDSELVEGYDPARPSWWRNLAAAPGPGRHFLPGQGDRPPRTARSPSGDPLVVGSFFASDNTCEICQAGYQTSCINREPIGANGAQAEYLRVPLADGTLVATPDIPSDDLVPSLLAASDVLGTGWFGAVAAEAGPGKTVAVVGDGAVGLLAVLAAKQLGAERIIAMSRHQPRQQLAVEFGATDIVSERGDAGVVRIKELTGGLGAHSVVEAVGTQESMLQAIRSARPGGHVGYVGVAHGVELPGEELFFSHVHLHGGPAPVRRFLPELVDLIWNRRIDPGKVFDLSLPLEQAAEGYKAMDQRRAIKTLLRP